MARQRGDSVVELDSRPFAGGAVLTARAASCNFSFTSRVGRPARDGEAWRRVVPAGLPSTAHRHELADPRARSTQRRPFPHRLPAPPRVPSKDWHALADGRQPPLDQPSRAIVRIVVMIRVPSSSLVALLAFGLAGSIACVPSNAPTPARGTMPAESKTPAPQPSPGEPAPTSAPSSPVPTGGAPKALGDPQQWACTADAECVQTCALGAVSKTWLAAHADLDTCDDGCGWKSDSIACRNGECVTLTASGDIDESCTKRIPQ